MIKNFCTFFFAVAVLFLASPVMAQDETLDPKAYCLKNFPANNPTGIDANAYCECAAKELGGKALSDKDDSEKARKKVVANLKPCLDKHAKGPVTDLCKTYNEQIKSMPSDGEKHPPLNCSCFYKKLVGNFTTAWGGQTGKELTKEQQEKVAQETIAACLK